MQYMSNPIYKVEQEPEQMKDEPLGVNFSYFTSSRAVVPTALNGDQPYSAVEPPKRGRPKKTKTLSNGDNVVLAEVDDLPRYQSNQPYIDTYAETTNMLKSAVMQIDQLNAGISQELEIIKASKTLKNKYSYISEMSSTCSNLLGTKISAIREMNKITTDCHNLEAKRNKENMGIDQDDDKNIMDMYNAFISTPMSNGYNPLGPGMVDITLPNGAMSGIVRADISDDNDIGYSNYVNNMSPEQHRMRSERNPNIQTVVRYNQETGRRSFDVVDTTTGQSVPGIARPADFLLEDLNINVRAGTARNSNINMDYAIILDNCYTDMSNF